MCQGTEFQLRSSLRSGSPVNDPEFNRLYGDRRSPAPVEGSLRFFCGRAPLENLATDVHRSGRFHPHPAARAGRPLGRCPALDQSLRAWVRAGCRARSFGAPSAGKRLVIGCTGGGRDLRHAPRGGRASPRRVGQASPTARRVRERLARGGRAPAPRSGGDRNAGPRLVLSRRGFSQSRMHTCCSIVLLAWHWL